MASLMVSSDGEGIYISNSKVADDIGHSVKLLLSDFISFGITFCNHNIYNLTGASETDTKFIKNDEIQKFIDKYNEFIHEMQVDSDRSDVSEVCSTLRNSIPLDTYIYNTTVIDSMRFPSERYKRYISELFSFALKIVVLYPVEFNRYLMVYTSPHDVFDNNSTYGISVYRIKPEISGSVGSYFASGNEQLYLKDKDGNTISLIPKVARTSASEVINNIESVDFNFMNHTVRSVTTNLRTRIKSMKLNIKEIIDKEYNRGYNAGLAVISDIPPGWTVGSVRGSVEKYFIYKGLIRPKYINKNGTTYRIPKAVSDLMFITEIAVPIRNTLGDCWGKGCHPHLNTTTGPYAGNPQEIPNLEWGSLCIGDLSGEPFGRLTEIVNQMEIINTGSMYGGHGNTVISILIDNNTKYEYDSASRKVFALTNGGSRGSAVAIHDNDSPWVIVYKNSAIRNRQSEIAAEWESIANVDTPEESHPEVPTATGTAAETTGNIIWNA